MQKTEILYYDLEKLATKSKKKYVEKVTEELQMYYTVNIH